MHSLKEYIGLLEDELRLEYGRTMNRIRFDNEVLRHPDEFSHITVPTMEPERVPQKGEMNVGAVEVAKQSCFNFSSFTNDTFFLICMQVVFPSLNFPSRRTKRPSLCAPC